MEVSGNVSTILQVRILNLFTLLLNISKNNLVCADICDNIFDNHTN